MSDLFELTDLWEPDHPDDPPFVLPQATVGKLQFIHQIISEQRKPVMQAAVASTDTVMPAVMPAGMSAASSVP